MYNFYNYNDFTLIVTLIAVVDFIIMTIFFLCLENNNNFWKNITITHNPYTHVHLSNPLVY
jgi:hypothetical protein